MLCSEVKPSITWKHQSETNDMRVAFDMVDHSILRLCFEDWVGIKGSVVTFFLLKIPHLLFPI